MQYGMDLGFGGNVFHLHAPYALLVEAFGNDGTVEPRDDYKQMCQWSADRDSDAFWEVYDYKVGTCYDREDGLAREQITEWHVQYGKTGRAIMIGLLDAAVRRLALQEIVSDQLAAAESFEDACGRATGAEQSMEAEIRALDAIKARLNAGHSVNIGERDCDGFFVLGGVSVTMSHGVRVAVGGLDEQSEEFSAPMSDIEAREIYQALGVYLDLLDERKA